MKDRRLSVDMISTLPPGIIETILCLLPIQEAARTSILSREWRYKWITIPKLEFNEDTFQHRSFDNEHALILAEEDENIYFSRENLTKRCSFFVAIYQVLFVHKGPIHEFTLSMSADETYLEIDQVIDRLSRNNTVKKFTLNLDFDINLDFDSSYRLLLSAFPLHHLTDLHLGSCAVYLQPSFIGFGSLTSLCLKYVTISQETLLHLLSKCPLLTRFSMLSDDAYIDDYSITQLFECLPVIEHLAIWCFAISFRGFANGVVLKEHPTSLVHLKYFSIEELLYDIAFQLPLLAFMMRSSPNLEKLKLHKNESSFDSDEEEISFALEDLSDIWLEHLKEFEFKNFVNVKYELDFVRLILTKSPVLKKVSIVLDQMAAKDEEMKILRILSCSPCASPVLEITVMHYYDYMAKQLGVIIG